MRRLDHAVHGGDDPPGRPATTGGLLVGLVLAALVPVAVLLASYLLAGLGLAAGIAMAAAVAALVRRRRGVCLPPGVCVGR
jgi:hypothetical protein